MGPGIAHPALALLPAGLAVPLILLAARRPALRETVSLVAALAQTALVALLVPGALAGQPGPPGRLALAEGVFLALRGDAAGVLFALLASALWVLTTVYSIGYTRAERAPGETRYFASFALCLFATVGIALAANLLTFTVFFELLTVATYPLVVHRGGAEDRRAGRMYLAYTLTGGTALLLATAWTHAVAGHGDFRAGGFLGDAGLDPAAAGGLLFLFVLGTGVKAAVIPLHSWLPVAMVAPTPVSALLHAVAVVKAGAFGVVRVTGWVFGPDLLAVSGGGPALAWVAVVTIVLASLAALAQDSLKRILAFSTISQLSYIVLGAALSTGPALTGGLLHMASHALLKITLFFCVGAIAVTAHVDRASQVGGLGRRMPLTMGAFAVAALFLAGLPPGAAFASKWRLLSGAAEAGAWAAVGALVLSTLLTLAYLLPIVARAFLEPASGPRAEARPALLVPLLLTAAGGLLLGLVPDGPGRWLGLAAAAAAAVTGTLP